MSLSISSSVSASSGYDSFNNRSLREPMVMYSITWEYTCMYVRTHQNGYRSFGVLICHVAESIHHVCTYVCMRVCTYVCFISVDTCDSDRSWSWEYASCIYVCMRVCMHVRIHPRGHRSFEGLIILRIYNTYVYMHVCTYSWAWIPVIQTWSWEYTLCMYACMYSWAWIPVIQNMVVKIYNLYVCIHVFMSLDRSFKHVPENIH